MLSLFGPGVRLCDGWNRREAMRIGGLGFLGAGLNLTDLLRTSATADGAMTSTASFGRARSCIVLFLMGGPPQHSTWDPKPDAPAEVRGDFGPIATMFGGSPGSEDKIRTLVSAYAEVPCSLTQGQISPSRTHRRSIPPCHRELRESGH